LFTRDLFSCIRYPYYAIRLLNRQNHLITWFRYTLWIVLYPLGAFIEGLIVYKSLKYYQSKRYLSIDLPNRLNFSFDFALFLQVYLVILPFGMIHLVFSTELLHHILFVGLYQMMIHMRSQRRKLLTKKSQ